MAKRLPRPFFIRNLDAGQLLETFLVSAVAAFLGVRFFLGATGYPRLGGGGLHIAHETGERRARVRDHGRWLARRRADRLQLRAHMAEVLLDTLLQTGDFTCQETEMICRRGLRHSASSP